MDDIREKIINIATKAGYGRAKNVRDNKNPDTFWLGFTCGHVPNLITAFVEAEKELYGMHSRIIYRLANNIEYNDRAVYFYGIKYDN